MMVRRRLKDLGIFKSGLTYSPEDICDEDKGVLVLRSSNIQDGKLVFNNNVYVDMDLHEKMLVSKGDILICSRNGSASLVGKTAIIDRDVKASWGAFMMLFRTIYDSSYMNYLLNVSITKSKGLFSTSTINQLTNSMLGDIFVDVFDTKEEQEQIGEYLDAKCGDIDNRIAVLEKEQKAYERLKVAVINRAVTEGLDPETPKRDSGLDWLGMIPEHWEVKRLKDLCTCNDEVLKEDTKGIIEYVEIGDVVYPKGITNTSFVDFEEAPSRARRITRSGDVIVSTVRTYLKAIAQIQRDGLIVSTGFAVLRPKSVLSTFLSHALLANRSLGWINAESKGTSYPAINSSTVETLPMAVPPLSEQKVIVEYLDTKCAAIDAKIGNIAKRIEAYKRLKRALINEVVTGKRAV